MYLLIPFHLYDAPSFPYVGEPVVPQNVVVPQVQAVKPRASRMTKAIRALALLGILLVIISWGPSLFYRLTGDASRYQLNASSTPVVASSYQPAFDRNLPMEDGIKISSIGVDGPIFEAEEDDYESALSRGFWRVINFGTPYDRELPTIIVAHRYGYLSWDNLFRRHNSFYNLPKLTTGDTIEIVWKQRKYTYAVYGESQGTEITDYNADLILYTCEDLSSDVKIFRYAKLLEI